MSINNKLEELKIKKDILNEKELEKRFNRLFSMDGISIDFDNIKKSLKLINKFNSFLNDYNLEEKNRNYMLREKDIFNLAREIISSINLDYLPDFDKFVDEKRIYFTKIPKIRLSSKTPVPMHEKTKYTVYEDGQSYIKIVRSFDYNDVCSLIHEFMHHTNLKSQFDVVKGKETILYTEFISIYFEFYASDYLLENKKINRSHISKASRFYNLKKHTNSIDYYKFILLLIYEEYKTINYDLFKETANKYGYSVNPNLYNEYIKNYLNNDAINLLKKKEIDKYDYADIKKYFNNGLLFYIRYLYGTLLAFAARKYLSKEDIVNYIEYFNNKEYNSDSINKIHNLQKYLINNDDIYDYIGDYLYEFKEGNKYGYR